MLRRWSTWVVVGMVIGVGVVAGIDALRSSDQQANVSTRPSATTTAENSASRPQPADPFAGIHGWIAYGDDEGIWAIDPTRPRSGDRKAIRFSEEPAVPVAWSRDGSKLLIVRSFVSPSRVNFSILNADGVEKRVLRLNGYMGFASLSPDGSQIICSTFDSGIYLASAEDGAVLLLKPRHLQWYASDKRSFRTLLFAETFSPDGSQIAYVDGMGDWGNSIRVMDADGSHVRVVVDSRQKAMGGHVFHLAWSPDGSRLAFDTGNGIWVVGLDGSGLRMVIRHGRNPTWSPDGSRLAFQSEEPSTGHLPSTGRLGPLRIADADGKNVQIFAHGGSGPWNPLTSASG